MSCFPCVWRIDNTGVCCEQLGVEGLPEEVQEHHLKDEKFLRNLHHALFEVGDGVLNFVSSSLHLFMTFDEVWQQPHLLTFVGVAHCYGVFIIDWMNLLYWECAENMDSRWLCIACSCLKNPCCTVVHLMMATTTTTTTTTTLLWRSFSRSPCESFHYPVPYASVKNVNTFSVLAM